jgi:hypothetical protein
MSCPSYPWLNQPHHWAKSTNCEAFSVSLALYTLTAYPPVSLCSSNLVQTYRSPVGPWEESRHVYNSTNSNIRSRKQAWITIWPRMSKSYITTWRPYEILMRQFIDACFQNEENLKHWYSATTMERVNEQVYILWSRPTQFSKWALCDCTSFITFDFQLGI